MTRHFEDPTGDQAVGGRHLALVRMVEYLLDTHSHWRHGDEAGYTAHRRRGETPCPDCRLGHAIYAQDRRAARLDQERARHRDYMRRRRVEGMAS